MPGLLLRRGGRCPSMPRIMMACIEDRGRLPLPPGMAVVCRALAGGGGSCAVVATHLLMLASRRAVAEFPSLLPPFDAAPHHARTRTASWKGPGAQGPRLPPSTALGGQHCGLCNLWMEKRFHARARVLPLFPVMAGVPPIQFLPHLFGPRSAVSLPPLYLSVVPPPPPQIAALQPLQEDPPTPGWFAIPRPAASLPASLPLSTTSAGQRRGILEYYGTAVPLFSLPPRLPGAVAKPTLLHAPSVQRPASCRPACRAVVPMGGRAAAVLIKTHTSPPSTREPRARSPISPIRLRLRVHPDLLHIHVH